jgi:hypothetical protein
MEKLAAHNPLIKSQAPQDRPGRHRSRRRDR